jgi:N-acetyl-gamma-glutamyl-phosphate reductase
MQEKIKVAVIGATGYTGAELVRLLVNHPKAELAQVISRSKAGKRVDQVLDDLAGQIDLEFSSAVTEGADLWFLALPHGASRVFLEEYKEFTSTVRIIDLSNEFRHKNRSQWHNRSFVFGMPELQKSAIETADAIANPGCFATAITLALAPLYHYGKIDFSNAVHINATTGSTGAGASLSETAHFSYRSNNLSWYKAFTHQHLTEIGEQLTQQPDTLPKLYFLPHRGDFTRGIFATAYLEYTDSLEQVYDSYQRYYETAPFTQVVHNSISLKQVVGTNFCHIHLHKHENTLLITSAIDNLLKGAAGQAIENMNLMYGLDQRLGLQLKSIAY